MVAASTKRYHLWPLVLLPMTSLATEPEAFPQSVPHDVTFTMPDTLENRKRDFDLFSWQSFAALNQVDQTNRSGDNATLWETFLLNTQVVKANGEEPDAWGTAPEIPPICQQLDSEATPKKVLSRTSKAPHQAFSDFKQVFEMGPVVDQNGKMARYEIRMNERTYQYIKDNTLYNREGQRRFAGPVMFPTGNNNTPEVGAITIKAAWKELGKGDNPHRFHRELAYIYAPASEEPHIDASCRIAEMGLVGLHITHKTEKAPQWVWSTFEHVDNAPTFPNTRPRHRYNFFNPDQTGSEINVAPPRPWTADATDLPSSQVVRMVPIAEPTLTLNQSFQTLFRRMNPNSVWQYYQLVNTQWPTDIDNPRSPLGFPEPTFLANTTMETFIQGERQGPRVQQVPEASSSCMSCHGNATTTTAKASDFTYLTAAAKEEK